MKSTFFRDTLYLVKEHVQSRQGPRFSIRMVIGIFCSDTVFFQLKQYPLFGKLICRAYTFNLDARDRQYLKHYTPNFSGVHQKLTKRQRFGVHTLSKIGYPKSSSVMLGHFKGVFWKFNFLAKRWTLAQSMSYLFGKLML